MASIDRLSDVLHKYKKADKSLIRKILNGDADLMDFRSYEQYQEIYKIRHDSIHWLICDQRELPFGEQKISSFQWDSKVTNHPHYKLIENQTPDIVVVSGHHVKITELTISRMKMADVQKQTKYKLLVDVLSSAGYDVSLEVIVINSLLGVPDSGYLKSEHKLSDGVIEQVYVIINNVDKVLHELHETQLGREWFLKMRGVTTEIADFEISVEDVLSFYDKLENKPFNNRADLEAVLDYPEDDQFNDKDESMIELLVNESMGITSKLMANQSPNEAVSKMYKFHEDNQNKVFDYDLRSFMPLPYFEQLNIDSMDRKTSEDEQDITQVTAFLENCADETLRPFSKMKGPIDSVKLTNEIKRRIALEGPGRKKYIRQGSPDHIMEQSKRKSIWYPIGGDYCQHIEEMSWYLSEIDNIDVSELTGPGLRYVKICESIFREININALRKDRGFKHVLKPTGVDGLYVLIYRGPKLRTGENLSTIWFRLILLKDKFKYGRMSSSWIFKKLHNDTNLMYSNWLSTDANRLDHYLRCYDKIIMAYSCYMNLGKLNLSGAISADTSNTLGMIIMIYMENKRSTSKMLQDVRYLIMSMLSMFTYYNDILSKFTDPIRTPLQSYLLDLIMKYSKNSDVRAHVLSSQFGKLNVDSSTGETNDRLSGAMVELPRILTKGPVITFKQMLCEMYFTMLFNKNQDDPTHASFQILSKILEGEKSLNEVKDICTLHTGYCVSDIEDAKYLIHNPHKNQFSRRAIMTASKLQSMSQFNKSNGGLAHRVAASSRSLNKTLDEFATFKSSSTIQNLVYNSGVYVDDHDADQKIEEDVKAHLTGDRNVQNRRRRCIEGVQELIEDEKCLKSFDLIPKFLYDKIYFQVFKKNQIGGVREILILDIKKRITINVLESFSRAICSEDDREMLTHGDRKVTLIRDLLRSLKRGNGKRLIMNYNFDKTRWAPSFMPIQFLYMFLPFKQLYPSFFRFLVVSLMNHSNKEFVLPEKLVRAWRADVNNQYTHFLDPNLQKLKEEFMRTKKLTYINESNMGQGILHYTSSYYHLCFISLRDEVYKRLCKRLKVDPGDWRDLVSSDDSYTAHSLPLDSKEKAQRRVFLFLRAQEVCERVMNIWTSTSKSSISLLIYEFNSLFGSNLTMYPTTFKFALAAVHPVSTDSFFRMVKESYIACRQIVENGGSLELYHLASKLNKKFCEHIYHTQIGGHNDLSKYGLSHDKVPYQLGVYPLMDPALMIMFGPECQNYKILLESDRDPKYLNAREKHLFEVMHTMVDVEDPEIYAAINNIDDIFIGVNRIEAHMGPIKRLELIKRQIPLNREVIQDRIENNPLMLFSDPTNMDELQVKVYIKLFQKGAAEALRTTAASIYYGRVSATVSANAFQIPFILNESKTYGECIELLLETKSNVLDMKYLYPHFDEFKSVYPLSQMEFIYEKRDQLETQNIRQLQLTKLQQRITNPIINLLNHYWVSPSLDPKTSLERDWINLKESLPIIRDSLEETLSQIKGDRKLQIRSLMLVILRLMGYSSKPMKAIIFGPSSRSYDNSYLVLKQQNSFSNSTTQESRGLYLAQNVTRNADKLNFAYNCFALSIMRGHSINSVNHKGPIFLDKFISEDDISLFLLDNMTNTGAFKKMMMLLMYHGHIEDVRIWSDKTKTIFHKWIKRGVRVNGRYSGSYVLRLQLSDVILQVEYTEHLNEIKLRLNSTENLFYAYELIAEAIEHSNMMKEQFINCIKKGSFVLGPNKLLFGIKDSGFHIHLDGSLRGVTFKVTDITYGSGFFWIYEGDELIFKTVEGLLHSNYIPSQKELFFDIDLHGIKLSKLLPLRPFDSNFSVEHLSTHDCLKLLDTGTNNPDIDLKVPKPSVSDITNRRLGVNLPVRQMDTEFAEVINEEMGPDMDEKTNNEDETPANYFQDFLVDSIDDIVNSSVILQSNFHDIWMDPDIDINIVRTMTRQKIVYQPRRVLERIINIKYQLITKMVTNVNMLNKKTIVAAQNQTGNQNIVYSLIYSYDRQFTNTDTPSPYGCELLINSEFDKRYSIQDQQLIL